MVTDDDLLAMAADLARVGGVDGVVLGGSRARGDALPSSDADLGVYYTGTPDTTALTALARRWSEEDVTIGPPGSWGDWVDTGGWLVVGGTPVDWILRDLDRVQDQCVRARLGEFAFHIQTGHPLGFLDVAYAGELAQGRILADPRGVLAHLRSTVAQYPEALRLSLPGVVGEASFFVDIAAKAVVRRDVGYIASCLSRACLLCGHALQAHAGRWVTNEKGLVPSVENLPDRPDAFSSRVAAALGSLGDSSASLSAAIEDVRSLVEETRARVPPRST